MDFLEGETLPKKDADSQAPKNQKIDPKKKSKIPQIVPPRPEFAVSEVRETEQDPDHTA